MFAPRSTLSRATSAPSSHGRPSWTARLVVASFGLFGLSACGASIHALYEGDVRFEHCMAFDDRAEVKDTIRTACWDEWLKFYTFGQTRDRIEYAKLRTRQLRGGSDFADETLLASESQPSLAVPEPTSAMAPPPMMMVVDAGTSAPPPPPDDKPLPPGSACSAACVKSWTKCKKECVTPVCNRQPCISRCEDSCQQEYSECMRNCFM